MLLLLLLILLVMASMLVLSSILRMQWLWIDPIGAILSSKVVVRVCAPFLLFSFSSSILPKPGAIPPLIGGIVAVQTNSLSLGWHHGKCRRR